MDLPLSYEEIEKSKQAEPNSKLTSYFNGPVFTPELMNMVLVVWIIRHALPWARFEDAALRAAFFTVNRGALVRSRTWAAQQSVQLFSALHEKAITAVKVSQLF